jgi:hypothetical protein
MANQVDVFVLARNMILYLLTKVVVMKKQLFLGLLLMSAGGVVGIKAKLFTFNLDEKFPTSNQPSVHVKGKLTPENSQIICSDACGKKGYSYFGSAFYGGGICYCVATNVKTLQQKCNEVCKSHDLRANGSGKTDSSGKQSCECYKSRTVGNSSVSISGQTYWK